MANKLIPGVNDLATINPSLAAEWHPTKNPSLTPATVAAYYNKNVFWLGKCGHTWSASVSNRNRNGRGCPYCSNQKLLVGFNDLKTVYPNLAIQWDYEKNDKKPEDVIAGGNTKYYWQCDNRHSFYTSIAKRRRGDGCPYCGHKKLLVGFNDLATTHPYLAEEWDYEKNNKSPQDYMAGSNEYAYWKCKKYGHSWRTKINTRKQGSNCPICAGQKVLPGFNDLATKAPALAKEWDYEKNDKRPSEVSFCSSLSYNWKCEFGHEWRASVTNRYQGRECPICDRINRTSFPEQAIYYYVERTYPDSINSYKDIFSKGMELDVFIPSINIGIEYDGPFHGSERAKERDIQKYKVCQAAGIRLIKISVNQMNSLGQDCDIWIHSDYDYKEYGKIDEFLLKLSTYLPLEEPFNTETEKTIIQKRYFQRIASRSLAIKNPELCIEWDYERNNGLTPEMFPAGSGEKVWWRCSLGHSWQAIITDRVRGTGCPYCSGQKVLEGFNDLEHCYPNVAKEWDYQLNAPELPSKIPAHSGHKKWWICPKGHSSYSMRVADRTQGRGCPECYRENAGKQFRKRVYQYSFDGELLNQYESATEAGKRLGVSTSAIANACKGKSKSSGGFIWKYEA